MYTAKLRSEDVEHKNLLAEILRGVGFSEEEIRTWVQKMPNGAYDYQSVRDALQYLVLMRSDCAAQALRELGFSPLVVDVYRTGFEKGWINETGLKDWGFSLVEEESPEHGLWDDYLVLVPMAYSSKMQLVSADKVEQVCATRVPIGPSCFPPLGVFRQVPVARPQPVREVVEADLLAQKMAAVALEQRDGLHTEVIDSNTRGYYYLELFRPELWHSVSGDVGPYPSVDGLMRAFSEWCGYGTVDGWHLGYRYPGVYQICRNPSVDSARALSGMKLALRDCVSSIVVEDDAPNKPFVLVRSDLDVVPGDEVDCVPGDVFDHPLVEVEGRLTFRFNSSLPVLVVIPSAVGLEFPGGQKVRHVGGDIVVLGLAGLDFDVLTGKSLGDSFNVVVGDEFEKDLWMRKYAWFGSDSTAARFISRVDFRLVVFNFGKKEITQVLEESEMPSLIRSMENQEWGEELPRGVEVVEIESSGSIPTVMHGNGYRLAAGKVSFKSSVGVGRTEIVLDASAEPFAMISGGSYACEMVDGSRLLAVHAVDAEELDDGGPDDGSFEHEF